MHKRFSHTLALAAIFLLISAGSAGGSAGAWELKVCANPDGRPYSSKDLTGFDNRVATVLADELGARLQFVWMPDHRLKTARGFLHLGDCDIVVGVLDGQAGFLTSHAFYRSSYVFVMRAAGPHIESLNDADAGTLRVGVTGGARRTTPPAVAMTRRGHRASLKFFGASAEPAQVEKKILRALDDGVIDVAILWGPVAGQLVNATQAKNKLIVKPVQPEIDIPFLPMTASLSVGVRPHDEALRDAIDKALAQRWDDIQHVLTEAQVPLLHLPQPLIQQVVQ